MAATAPAKNPKNAKNTPTTNDTTRVGDTKADAKEPKERKKQVKRPKRPVHPALQALEKGQKLDTLPPDFDFDKFLPLKRASFSKEDSFFDYRADHLLHESQKLRAKAEDSRKLGSGTDRVKAKRLQAMLAKTEELKAQLTAAGVNVEELVAAARVGETTAV